MNCPSCGQEILFRSERAPYAVCPACATMVVRKELDVESLGTVAECQPDGSPLQLYSQGSHHGRGFTLIGRIQLSYGDGFWNEWYLQYSDGKDGWLGEAMGQFFLSQLLPDVEYGNLPESRLSVVNLGTNVRVEGEDFALLDRKQVQIASFEGELPFVDAVGRPFLTLDLRSADGGGLTIDYSSATPTVYRGRWLQFSDLSLTGLRTRFDTGVSVPASEVRKVACASCGAPHELATGPQSRLLVCAYCGSAMDTTHPELVALGTVIDRAKELANSATLPIGTEAHFAEAVYRVIGFVESATDISGVVYSWTEYLLYNHLTGYRWISESQGHFTLFTQLPGVPVDHGGVVEGTPSSGSLRAEGIEFKHFQTSRVKPRRVVGEFYWRVAVGDETSSYDYIHPPYLLSASRSEDDITWSIGRYLERDQLAIIFPSVRRFPQPRGVAPNQPNPYSEMLKALRVPILLGLTLGMLLVASGLFLPRAETIVEKQGIAVTSSQLAWKTDLAVPGPRDLLVTLSSPDLEDRFSDLTLLIDGREGQASQAQTVTLAQLGQRGTTSAKITLTKVPAGQRQLQIQAKSGPADRPPRLRTSKTPEPPAKLYTLDVQVKTIAAQPAWGGFFLFLVLLLLPPLFYRRKSSGFETSRWYESDYG